MTNEEYQLTQDTLVGVVAVLRGLDLRAFLQRIDRAEAVAPIIDPTLYRQAAVPLGQVRRLAAAALALAQVSHD